MSNLVDINGNELGEFDKKDCPVGTLLLCHMVGCLIEKDDVVYKLTLNFGDAAYTKRIPLHEFNNDVLKECWNDLLKDAFVNHALGMQNRGALVGVKVPNPKPSLVK